MPDPLESVVALFEPGWKFHFSLADEIVVGTIVAGVKVVVSRRFAGIYELTAMIEKDVFVEILDSFGFVCRDDGVSDESSDMVVSGVGNIHFGAGLKLCSRRILVVSSGAAVLVFSIRETLLCSRIRTHHVPVTLDEMRKVEDGAVG